ncbi:acyl-CoA dehydrogenase NM domain-like protein [Apiospora sp. TS-2023a]
MSQETHAANGSSASQALPSGLVLDTSVDEVSVKPEAFESEVVGETQSSYSISAAGVGKKTPDDRRNTASRGIVGEAGKRAPTSYTAQDVTQHNKEKDLWIVVGSDIYDVTEFQHQHPGSAKVMRAVAGKDATNKFDKHHRRDILEPYKPKYQVGVLVAASASRVDWSQADTVASERKGGLLGKLWRVINDETLLLGVSELGPLHRGMVEIGAGLRSMHPSILVLYTAYPGSVTVKQNVSVDFYGNSAHRWWLVLDAHPGDRTRRCSAAAAPEYGSDADMAAPIDNVTLE